MKRTPDNLQKHIALELDSPVTLAPVRLAALLVVLFFLAASLFAQTPAEETIKVDTLLVNVPVFVSDKKGLNVPALKKENFFVIEDGERRNVDFFADVEEPLNVAILVDVSVSTTPIIGEIKRAAQEFVKTLRPGDKCLLSTFSDDMEILQHFTSDQKKLEKAVDKIRVDPLGRSNMQDAVFELLVKHFDSINGRKAIVILTDGGVMGRKVSNAKLVQTVMEEDVLVYPIVFKMSFPPGSRSYIPRALPRKITLPNGEVVSSEEFQKRIEIQGRLLMDFIKSLATVSGGKTFDSDSVNLKKTFENIADELKKQYVVGFYPTNVDDGKSHKVWIEVQPKELTLRTKSSIRIRPGKK